MGIPSQTKLIIADIATNFSAEKLSFTQVVDVPSVIGKKKELIKARADYIQLDISKLPRIILT